MNSGTSTSYNHFFLVYLFKNVILMPYRKFIKDVGLIGITQVLIGLGGFFLLPVITKTLGSYDYGIWTQINITVSLLSPLALMGLSMGVVRFLSSEKDKEKIRGAGCLKTIHDRTFG